jgi:hypothetical protein
MTTDECKRSLIAISQPLASLESRHMRDRLGDSDIVWGYNETRDEVILFWGEQVIEDLGNDNAGRWDGAEMIVFRYAGSDASSEEQLAEAIGRAKGKSATDLLAQRRRIQL